VRLIEEVVGERFRENLQGQPQRFKKAVDSLKKSGDYTMSHREKRSH